MFFASTRQGCIGLLVLGLLLARCQPLPAQRLSPPSADELIQRLDHDSFATRRAASQDLTTAGLEQWQQQAWRADGWQDDGRQHDVGRSAKDSGLGAIGALRSALQHESAEVRLAAERILREISVQVHEAELSRLLNPHCESASIRLALWPTFLALVGDDVVARSAFATISRRFALSPFLVGGEKERVAQRHYLTDRLDPYRLDPEDSTAWMLLLILSLHEPEPTHYLAPRIAVSMSHCPMGPVVPRGNDGLVMGRLIDAWVRKSGRLCGNRERLLIAMRYECRNAAQAICDRIFGDASAPPATVVTGLLAASALDRSDLDNLAMSHLDDDRVANVWQLIPASQTRIRTEVRDVALAVLLHRRGIDPRRAGYEQLQADPQFRYRDYSLGFADEATRTASRRRANDLLAE